MALEQMTPGAPPVGATPPPAPGAAPPPPGTPPVAPQGEDANPIIEALQTLQVLVAGMEERQDPKAAAIKEPLKQMVQVLMEQPEQAPDFAFDPFARPEQRGGAAPVTANAGETSRGMNMNSVNAQPLT